MKRIAIFYDNRFGRNDGPPLYYLNALRTLYKNDDIVHLIPNKEAEAFGSYDYTFWVDWGEDGLPWSGWYPKSDRWGKRIYIASDTHLGKEYRYKTAHQFDYVFFNQLRAVEEYDGKSTWLPHATEETVYKPFPIIKKYDVCFIGHIQDVKNYNGMTRVDALDRLFKEFPNFYWGCRNPMKPGENMFEDAAKKFSQSKIVFNISIGDDVNMRVFETLSTKSFQLTNKLPTLEKLFEDGKDLVTYSGYDDMVSKVRYYLNHDSERERIAESGYKKVLANHTYRKNIKKIFEVIK